MKIYTKTGDGGETGLLGGVRVSKSHLAIHVCGELDELNSMIGLIRSGDIDSRLDAIFLRVQNDLFDLGARVAACLGESHRVPSFGENRFEFLDSKIDEFQSEVSELKQFILPDGSTTGCRVHLARAVCRRGERSLVALKSDQLKIALDFELIYLNRLSDFLFVAARWSNQQAGSPETAWQVGESAS